MQMLVGFLAAVVFAVSISGTAAMADEVLLQEKCLSCHVSDNNELTRIKDQRKTPEGWLMTIVRMRQIHGLDINLKEQASLVHYLSEIQGMAPSETADYRYALEKDPDAQEAFGEPMASMCARCHTGARVALQRRTQEEWDLHIDFHLGQYPTIEYQALGRDREWFKIAKEEMVPLLSKLYPLQTSAWEKWRVAEKPNVTGKWIVLTEFPEHGAAYGQLTVSGKTSPFKVEGEMVFAGGVTKPVKGVMNLYSGYEWRANLKMDDTIYRQVLAVSEDGKNLTGRQFLRSKDSLGGRFKAARADGEATILGTVPAAVPSGSETAQIVGAGLGSLNVTGNGTAEISANPYGAMLNLKTKGNGVLGLNAGASKAQLAHYDSIDSLRVEPAFTIARVGGGSKVGPARVPARFKAVGFWNGPDGKPKTDDDIRVGEIPADWKISDHNEQAAAMKDAKFAGVINMKGIFTPGIAGPNAERPFSTNNAGDLKVTAEAMGLNADAQLIVTVQRFIDPPIR